MRDMRAAGQEPNVTTWSTLMNAHALKGDAAACERVMRDMRAAGQEPDVTTWNTLMNAHAGKGDAAACERVMRDMRAAAASSFSSSSSSSSPLLPSSSVPSPADTCGIGVSLILEKNGHVTIDSVALGRGAADADIRRGNRILKVAGQDVTSSPVALGSAEAKRALDRVTALLIGKPGTQVKLLIEFSTSQGFLKEKLCSVTRK
jgi:pentatricopeptide repeat protein